MSTAESVPQSEPTPEQIEELQVQAITDFRQSLIGSRLISNQANFQKIVTHCFSELQLPITLRGLKVSYADLMSRADYGGLQLFPEANTPVKEKVPEAPAPKKPFAGSAADKLYLSGAGTSRLATARATGDDKEQERQNLKKTMQSAVESAEKTARIRAQRKEIDDIAIYRNNRLDHAATGRAKAELRTKYGFDK